MPNIFDIDYGLQIENLINPTKREETTLDFHKAIVEALQYSRDRLLDDYKKGASYAAYNIGTTYAKYDRVIFTDKAVYESKVDSNIGILPAGAEPDSSLNWRKTQDVYIGTDELIKYNGQTIVILYALNKWFGTSAPNLIYIVNPLGSAVGFELFFPLATYNALASNNTDRFNIVYTFLKKYVPEGIFISITTY